jgi:prepilin-type N-terminal cleavage/methylation domain-containing protein
LNSKGFTLIEVLMAFVLVSILVLIVSPIYSKRIGDTNAINIILKDIDKILSYYEQTNCATTIPPGCNSVNPFGYNYTITCGGNNRTTIVTTTLPPSLSTIPLYPSKRMFCYKNGNNLICYNVWNSKREEDMYKN